jgi:DNA-binding GntR family transcriptional regulator
MKPALKPLKRPSALRDQVYDRIRNSIRSGQIGVGAKLLEIPVSEQLGISRTPVREALALLANEGLIVSEGRGYQVPALTGQDIADIIALRRLIEPAAAGLAAQAATPEGNAALQAALACARTAEAAGDPAEFTAANAAFRDAWIALVRNPRIARALTIYEDHVQHLRTRALSDPAVRRMVLDDMVGLAQAVAARDAGAAQAVSDRHLGRAEAALRAALARL